jgi:hypothetical protein
MIIRLMLFFRMTYATIVLITMPIEEPPAVDAAEATDSSSKPFGICLCIG